MAKKKSDKKAKNENKYKNKLDKKAANTKKKAKIQVQKVIVTINCTYNNTIVTASDPSGNVLASSSPGVIGFSGSRKSTAFASTAAAEDVVEKLQKYGAKEASVIVKGMGMGRQASVKGLRSGGLKITLLSDQTPIPHGGTKPRKKPRGS